MSDLSPEAVEIERYGPLDLDAIMEIEVASFTAPWSRSSYEELAPLDSVDIWVARAGGRLVGYMLFQHVGSEMELHTLAVAPDMRRRGIAKRLLETMSSEAARLDVKDIFLQVRPTNGAARALYGAMGFKEVGLRRAYYKDDGEDALVLKLVMGERQQE